MRNLLCLLVLSLLFACNSSPITTSSNSIEHNNLHQQANKDLVGKIDKATLLQEPYLSWYQNYYSKYSPNPESISGLSDSLNNYEIKVFMGTWCHDSKREVPRLLNILDQTNYDFDQLQLIALNYSKTTPEQFEAGLNIQRTPTFVFFKNEVEVGRIVETPRESLEKDMLKIISGQDYKHAYQN